MKIKCLRKEGYQFSRKDVKSGKNNKIVFERISLNTIYNVYGIIIFQEELKYLIYDDYEMPSWYSSDLFEVANTQLPFNWHYNFYGYNEYGLSATWGYYELVNVEEHHSALIEGDGKAEEIFYKRKKEIDDMYFEK